MGLEACVAYREQDTPGKQESWRRRRDARRSRRGHLLEVQLAATAGERHNVGHASEQEPIHQRWVSVVQLVEGGGTKVVKQGRRRRMPRLGRVVRRRLGQRMKFVEAVVRGGEGQHSIVDESRGVWVDKGRRA
jgi:hypothetical protein